MQFLESLKDLGSRTAALAFITFNRIELYVLVNTTYELMALYKLCRLKNLLTLLRCIMMPQHSTWAAPVLSCPIVLCGCVQLISPSSITLHRD